jgi:hypothetical protein
MVVCWVRADRLQDDCPLECCDAHSYRNWPTCARLHGPNIPHDSSIHTRRCRGPEICALLYIFYAHRKQSPLHATKAFGGRGGIAPTHSLCPGERTSGTHCRVGWVRLRAGLDTEVRGKVLCPCRGSNPDRPVVQSDTILTELLWLLFCAHHHVAIKELGHLLTRSSLTYPVVSSMVLLGSVGFGFPYLSG